MELPDSTEMTEQEIAEHNAIAWLSLTDRELIERSASLDLPADLHPEKYEPTGRLATEDELVTLRANADSVAAELTSIEFVQKWVYDNRPREGELRYVSSS